MRFSRKPQATTRDDFLGFVDRGVLLESDIAGSSTLYMTFSFLFLRIYLLDESGERSALLYRSTSENATMSQYLTFNGAFH